MSKKSLFTLILALSCAVLTAGCPPGSVTPPVMVDAAVDAQIREGGTDGALDAGRDGAVDGADRCSLSMPSMRVRTSSYSPFAPSCGGYASAPADIAVRWAGTALVAVPSSLFMGGMACGTCVAMQGPVGTVMGRVVEFCDTCTASEVYVQEGLFYSRLTGRDAGISEATLTPVPCPEDSGDIVVQVDRHTLPFFVMLRLLNHTYPVTTVEVRTTTGFVAMERGAYGSFSWTVSGDGRLGDAPHTLRITSFFGQAIEVRVDLSALGFQLTGNQFNSCR